MGFFDRNRQQLAARGIDPARLPPGQYVTDRFPVLHAGGVPDYPSLDGWTLELSGLVAGPVTLTWAQLLDLPSVEVVVDIHCVTKWSKLDTRWQGVAVETLLEQAGGAAPGATHVLGHAEHGFSANVPLADCLGVDDRGRPRAMVAYAYDGQPLDPEHGYPARLLVPHLYFWKSPKWLRGIELLPADQPGFWERNGYHMYGDPFREQRFSGD
ncbi:MAG: sulfite oxidase-like oxidoreductase [Acidimicrobiales bacterium]